MEHYVGTIVLTASAFVAGMYAKADAALLVAFVRSLR